MKKVALLLVAAALSVGAFAQKPAPKKAEPQMYCAVQQDDKVDIAKATKSHMFADYKGRRYFFCCNGCPQQFAKNPAKYSKTAKSIPTPKAAKAKH